MVKFKPSLEFVFSNFRIERAMQLKAFDIYKSNVNYGLEEETEEQKQEIISWYNAILDFPDKITVNTVVDDFPKVPKAIKKYL